MDAIDCVVIGGGVVGLAIARALALAGRETLILESAERFGSGISSRNSEVIHAGIYYPQGSLKARLCVAGRALLYDYCRERNIAHRRCGKLIVAATPGQLGALDRIAQAAAANGVADLLRLDAKAAQGLEPALACVGALLSPSTGIVDAHGFMLSLLGDAQGAGAEIAYLSAVTTLRVGADGIEISINDEAAPALRARLVVNAAGLAAQDVARRIVNFPAPHIPATHYAKGSYFALTGRAPFSRLVYPVPEPGGLGIHLTLDLGGQARFGPDVEWVNAPDYQVDPAHAAAFYPAIRAYWPGLPEGALTPAYAGVRPKLSGPGAPPADFRIDGPATHGVPGIIQLFGIESPGLTAALAIAEHVAAMAAGEEG